MDYQTSAGSSLSNEITWTSGSKRSSSLHHSSNSGDYGKIARHDSRRNDSEMVTVSTNDVVARSRIIYLNDPDKTNATFNFARNSIRTGKYSVISFVPRNLFEQFHRVAYIYFLIIAVLNQIPQVAVFGRGASILPLAFVVFVTAVKDAYEDWRRHRSDKIENNRLASVLVSDHFREKKWKDIRVGEMIKIHANESIPCDMVLLSTSESTGVAYVQTMNLDGESNLKTRYAKQETILKYPEAGLLNCEGPNRNIYGFHGNMEIAGKRLSLGSSNIVLRGCELKNTEWAVGVAVYCGKETKAMLNSSGAPSKRSKLEIRMNKEIIVLSILLIALCLITSIGGVFWLHRHNSDLDYIPFYRKKDYNERQAVNYHFYGTVGEFFITFLMAVIVFQIMIPISLYISMELVRVGQSYFMIRDSEMYDECSNSRFQCRALNINEDLGQIKYVFSDKTGTLTENKMEFRCASIWGRDYSGGRDALREEDEHSVKVNTVKLVPKIKVKVDPQLLEILQSKSPTENRKQIEEFFLALAACNTIVPIQVDAPDPNSKCMEYQGESPDEQALAYAAAAYGYMLIERTSGHIYVDVQGDRQRFNVLGMHEFDSDRKRMSVILGCPDGAVKVFSKGADATMLALIDQSANVAVLRETEAHLHQYASQGLRTLVVAAKELSNRELTQWQTSFEQASQSLVDRTALLSGAAALVELNLRLLGASGIEDKLQEGVPEAIQSLRIAGIKVWVLTGDKQETAISIGYSSKLLTRGMTQIVVNSNSKESSRKGLEDGLEMVEKVAKMNGDGAALIIDGSSLVHVFDSELEEQLFELSRKCAVVLCCRVAPFQKGDVVALVKTRTSDLTLSIGDGANDVSMIQMADVGVGISGQEGREAVMASDFAMGQFRFLVPLLLVHGHWNYQRIGYMVLYNFYRNAVFVLVLFWYVLYTAFTLTTAINEWCSVLYSVIFTFLPTIAVGILDKDLSRRTLLRYPQLYKSGHRQECYNTKLFWLAMADTLWQSVAVFFVPILAYRNSEIDAASLGDLWTIAAVVLVNLHLALDVVRWTWIIHAVVWGSILATFVCVVVIDSFPSLVGYWAIFHAAGTAKFWLCVLCIVVMALVPRVVVTVLRQYYFPSDVQVAREAEKFCEDMELLNGGGAEMEMADMPASR